jgi:type I restriction enzyme M protein
LQFEEFSPCLEWWKKRDANERAWKVQASDVLKYDEGGNLVSVNLDIKNPSAKQDFEHLPPERLADDILKKERRIAELMAEIKQLL